MTKAISTTTTAVPATTPGLPSPSRRRLLAGSGLAAGLAAIGLSSSSAAAFAHPTPADTELAAIGRACVPVIQEYNRCSAAFFALEVGDPALEAVAGFADAPCAVLDVMVDRATELRATIWGEYVAKARLLRHEMLMEFGTVGQFDPDMVDARDLLAWSLVNDMLAGSAVA